MSRKSEPPKHFAITRGNQAFVTLGLFPVNRPPALFRTSLCKNYFRRISTYVITVPKRHGQTDRRTDGRTDDMQSHNGALRSIAR